MLFVAACVVVGAVGCDERVVQFQPDALLRAKNDLTAEQSASIDAVLAELFGSPDQPVLPVDLPRMAELCDLAALEQAAGPVESHEVGVVQGLFRRHCARCHGVTGDGRGPTARYQAPYPRDFRRGVFKWKSTYRDAPPTVADLDRVIENGVAGTAMPSFRLVSQEERAILRQYVVYLAIRGQVERALVDFVANELPINEPLAFTEELREEIVVDYLAPIIDAWVDARESALPPLKLFDTSGTTRFEIGRRLYHGEKAGCYKCHGSEGEGGAVAGRDFEIDYDLWNRDRVVVDPSASVRQLLREDLPARPATPRRLHGEKLRGGEEPVDLYRRVHQGIAGTPMPAVGGDGPETVGSLTDAEIVAIVWYLRYLANPHAAEWERLLTPLNP